MKRFAADSRQGRRMRIVWLGALLALVVTSFTGCHWYHHHHNYHHHYR